MDIKSYQQMRESISKLLILFDKIQQPAQQISIQQQILQPSSTPSSSHSSKTNPLYNITSQLNEIQLKKCIFQWIDRSEDVIKEINNKKNILRKKEIKNKGIF